MAQYINSQCSRQLWTFRIQADMATPVPAYEVKGVGYNFSCNYHTIIITHLYVIKLMMHNCNNLN